ncbi:glutathione peroxidase [Sporosarcina cyprini]|uniref:glutathione peroxidase n=1 Tax=Sporosarcina cyprini TaxID=2910523 RepID=UPI001EE011D9|nr:glutathione peroxidase [Sporosarcina cyprini]MCG3088537.1 glutathione peroxidase [Sporosarcina cyprini]
MSIYNYLVKKPNGEILSMETYRGKAILIVNTASRCRFTYQFEELQKLYDQYKEQGLVVLGFPCDQFGQQNPENGEESVQFCQRNYGVSFPVFDLVQVNGKEAEPLFTYLKHEVPFRELDDSIATEKMLKARLQQEYPDYLIGRNIRWNFTKFLVDASGAVVKRFEPTESVLDVEAEIERILPISALA